MPRTTVLAPRSHYELLGLRRDASFEAIRAAYRSAILAAHPDLGPATERIERERRTVALNAAYTVLKDGAARAAYDARLVIPRTVRSRSRAKAHSARPTHTRRSGRATGTGGSTSGAPSRPRTAYVAAIAKPLSGWLLVTIAAILGWAVGGLTRAIDAFCWVGLAHLLLSRSAQSPLAATVIAGLSFLERLIHRSRPR